MTDYIATSADLTTVADAIRTKGGTSAPLVFPNGFATAIANIPTGTPTLETKSKTYTATESQQTDQVTPSVGYDGLDKVNVTISAIPSNYVGSGITQRTSTDLSASGATVTAPAGYYASNATKSVASGTAGTPTATKSAVLNHSLTVTPSVTNTTGYITGSTKTGTAVSVSASELVSGSQNITTNNTYDVTNLASVVVNVSGGGGLEYEEGTWTPATDTSRGTIYFTNAHTNPPSIIVLADATGTDTTDMSQLNVLFVYVRFAELFGVSYPYAATTTRDGYAGYAYRTTTTASSTSQGGYANIIEGTSGNDGQYSEYWATNTAFYPYTNSTTRQWYSSRSYKWLAIWK